MLEQIFLHQKQFSFILRKDSLAHRFESLKTLEKIIESHIPEICIALQKDFGKPEAETLISEIYPVIHEIRHARRHLKKWTQPQKTLKPLTLFSTQNSIYHEPKGVCLIIGPWNYPFNLMMSPLVSAIASGNCIFLKPSELTVHTSALITKMIQENFNEEHLTVIEGGPEVTQELLKLPFDHIFFTGSTRVGKIIMEAASKNLSSVTLELGGKSPTIVDSTANLKYAAEKIAWAKFLNASQTCVAPDYVFVQESVLTPFKDHLITKLKEFYGDTPEEQMKSPHLARLISESHTQRLKDLLDNALASQAVLTWGGLCDIKNKMFAPTILEKVDLHSTVMQEEIFGPLLPLVSFKELSEVIHFINDRPKPLALYLYSHSEMHIQDIIQQTSSGGVCVNESIVHLSNPYLPFGGVGESGLGNYHGYFGFKAFSHEKPVLRQSNLGKLLRLLYPPYTPFKVHMIKKALRWIF